MAARDVSASPGRLRQSGELRCGEDILRPLIPVSRAGGTMPWLTLYILPLGRSHRHGRDPLLQLLAVSSTFDEMRLLSKVGSWRNAVFVS